MDEAHTAAVSILEQAHSFLHLFRRLAGLFCAGIFQYAGTHLPCSVEFFQQNASYLVGNGLLLSQADNMKSGTGSSNPSTTPTSITATSKMIIALWPATLFVGDRPLPSNDRHAFSFDRNQKRRSPLKFLMRSAQKCRRPSRNECEAPNARAEFPPPSPSGGKVGGAAVAGSCSAPSFSLALISPASLLPA